MEQTENNKIIWVRGNTQPLIIPLEQEVMTEQEEIVAEPYYPDGNATVTVNFVSQFKKYSYTPQVDGNLLIFTDNAQLPAGCYGIEVLVSNPDGTQYRSQWDNQVVVTNSNPSVLQEWDEFKDQDVKARAAIFFFAKGDPFTYEDFTSEQIEDLKKPATDAAADVAALEQNIEAAEALRVEAERGRVEAEAARELQASSDHGRAGDDHTLAVDDHQTASGDHQTASDDHTQAGADHTASVTATGNANDAAALANQKAGLAAEKAALADQKATEAGKVNASLNGTEITVTDRNGNSVTQDIKGDPGSDADVTTENIVNALGYTPADKAVSDNTVERVTALEVTQEQLDTYFPSV